MSQAHAIEVRRIPFAYDQRIHPVWNTEHREWSHMVNGASLAMPYLEPFLNRTLRAASKHIADPALLEDIEGFVRQEAQHYQQHRRYNEILKAHGYAELAAVEESMRADYEALERRSLNWRLAYAAGFETMTMGITEWLVNDRAQLFKNADPTISSLVLWHMVEETEHKSVAFDVYQAVCGSYWLRVAGLVWGSLHVGLLSRRGYRSMLRQDGLWRHMSSRLKLWRWVACFFAKAGSAMLRSLRPSYHPDRVEDPVWVMQWRAAYGSLQDGQVPLLDTAAATIPAAFENQ